MFCGAQDDCTGSNRGQECIGKACMAGYCQTACPGVLLLCGTVCVDPQSSWEHCGASLDCQGTHAGVQCRGMEACVTGGCVESPGSVTGLRLVNAAGVVRSNGYRATVRVGGPLGGAMNSTGYMLRARVGP